MGQQLRRVGRRWQTGVWLVLFAVALGLTMTLSPGRFSLAQDNPSTAKEEFIQEIEDWAKRDAQLDNIEPSEAVQQAYRKFGDNPFELEEPDIYDIYIEAFIEERDRLEGDFWEQLPVGWIAAGILLIWSVFSGVLQEKLTVFINKSWDWLYQRIAGNPLFLNLALRKYQEALQAKLTNLDTPFKIEPPLAMAEVYVPLKIKQVSEQDEPRVQPLSQGTELDIYTAMVRHKRLMVTGPPGSGKSVLLKHIAFTYGEGRLDLPGQPIPVRLELNSLRSAELDEAQFIGKLVGVLDANGFPNATRFVEQRLESGKLLLLLDGLDEVPSEIRDAVVVVMNGVLAKYEKCPAIITCRTAVYEHEFDVVLERNLLEVVEFTDYQIRNFLQAWKSRMPAEKSVEQLMQTLQDRPKIKTLARNPLLLTIITYLYTETTFVLPHSRAEFYEKATNMLLELRDQERNIPNRYSAVAKRQVLRRLALVAQDTLNPENPDRRSIPHQVVRQEVGQVLPDLNLAVEETNGILQEIIERSGLLLEIDGGERFQFAHLTLQEFFAAAALQTDQSGLVERFERDALAWREVVKLWCGLAGNSTELIRAIYGRDELLAFECLAEVQEVEQALADEIFERVKGQLERAAREEDVARAFGAVAADVKSRGKFVLSFLEEQLKTASELEIKSSSAYALSMTNLPQAADILAEQYQYAQSIVLEPLIRMENVSFKSIYQTARKGCLEVLDILLLINTPDSAKELANLIWDEDEQLASRAAWRLAAMISKSEIENEMDKMLDFPKSEQEEFDWIWLPFAQRKESSLLIIAGQIARLISAYPEQPKITEFNVFKQFHCLVDPRILIPVFLFHEKQIEKINISPEKAKEIEHFLRKKDFCETDAELELYTMRLLARDDLNHFHKKILKSTNLFFRIKIIHDLSKFTQKPSKQDWIEIFKPIKQKFLENSVNKIVILASISASISAMIYMLLEVTNELNSWFIGLTVITIFANILFWYTGEARIGDLQEPSNLNLFGLVSLFEIVVWATLWSISWVAIEITALTIIDWTRNATGVAFLAMVVSGFTGSLLLFILLFMLDWGNQVYKNSENKFILLAFPWFPITTIFSFLGLKSLLAYLNTPHPWWFAIGIWLTLFATCCGLWVWDQRKDRALRNPLHGILDDYYPQYKMQSNK
ncbi:MAG: NACHT domain-containing protein [Cyanobacteria bacterium P01_G01_bin.54]